MLTCSMNLTPSSCTDTAFGIKANVAVEHVWRNGLQLTVQAHFVLVSKLVQSYHMLKFTEEEDYGTIYDSSLKWTRRMFF